MARQFFAVESVSRETTSSISYVDKAALSFTPDANSSYLIIWSCLIDGSNQQLSSRNPKARLFHDTSAITLAETNGRIDSTSEALAFGGMAFYQSPASPAQQTFSIEYADMVGTEITGISDAVLVAVKADAADAYASNASTLSTTSGTYQDALTLSFTPPSAGDYLIFAYADTGCSNTNIMQVRLFDGAASYGELTPRRRQNGTWVPWTVAVRRTLSGAQTWKIQHISLSPGNAESRVRNLWLVAVRLDAGFESHAYAESLTETTTTAAADKVTINASVAGADHLLFATGFARGDATSTLPNAWSEQDAAMITTRPQKGITTSNTWKSTATTKVLSALSGGAHTWKTRFQSETGGSTVVAMRDATLIVLQLTAAGGGAIALEGAALVIATAGGVLSTAIPLVGATAGLAVTGGSLSTQVTLAAAALAQAAAAAALSTQLPLGAAARGEVAAGGALSAQAGLAGAAVGQAQALAELTVQIRLAAAALAQALARGEFSDTALSGAAAGESLAAGALSTQIPVTGAAVSTVSAQGALTTGIRLAAVAASAARGDGALTVALTFRGEAAAQALAAASLTTEIRLEAAAVAEALAAGLLGAQEYHADPRYAIGARGRGWRLQARGRQWRIAS